jgi:hypothetical protein
MSADQPLIAVRFRDLERHDLTRGRLRTRDWQRLSQGLHVRTAADRSLTDELALLADVLPRDSGFGHLSSALLRRWWQPHRLPRHVAFATTLSGVHVQRRGLYVRRSRYAEVEEIDGVPVMTAPQTLIELARDLSLVDLVPMVDRALASGADPVDIARAARPGARGSRNLRRALALADERSESWWESVLRLQHTLTGLGPVEAQVEIHDDSGFVARADLHLVGTSRYPECDGGEHRTKDRHSHDLKRDKALARLNAERFGYTTDEILRRPEMVIRDGESARGLPHDPGRPRRWWRAARVSTLTGHGRTLLAARLRRYAAAAEHPVASSGRVRRAPDNQNSPLGSTSAQPGPEPLEPLVPPWPLPSSVPPPPGPLLSPARSSTENRGTAPAQCARTSIRPSPEPVRSKRTRASWVGPPSTSLMAQPTLGAALIVTRPREQEPETRPPRVVRLRTTGAAGAEEVGEPAPRVPDVDRGDAAEDAGAGRDDGDADDEEPADTGASDAPPPPPVSVTWSPPGSVNGSPTSPAAPKPTPTEAAANSPQRATSPSRLRTRSILPPGPLTRG